MLAAAGFVQSLERFVLWSTVSAAASVSLLVNGQPAFTTSTPPYQTSITVPVNATSITFGTTAVAYGNNVGAAPNDVIQVIPDPGTTVTGKVVDGGGNPLSGATVSTAEPRSSTTIADGSFSIAQVPTILGSLQVRASFLTSSGATLAGVSNALPPVVGGITTVGRRTRQRGSGNLHRSSDPANADF